MIRFTIITSAQGSVHTGEEEEKPRFSDKGIVENGLYAIADIKKVGQVICDMTWRSMLYVKITLQSV